MCLSLKGHGRLGDHVINELPVEARGKRLSDYVDEKGEWNWNDLQFLLPHHIVVDLHSTLPPVSSLGDDCRVWDKDKSGSYTVRSAYSVLAGDSLQVSSNIWTKVWKWKGPERIRFFIWMLSHNRLKTNIACHKWSNKDPWCVWCSNTPECALHVLRDCPRAMRIWNLFLSGRERNRFYNLQREEWIEENISGNFRSAATEDWGTLWGVIAWYLWNWRNAATFNESFRMPHRPDLVILNYISSINRATLLTDHLPGTSKVQMQIHWLPPHAGSLKLNTDGAAKGIDGSAGCGGLVRDETGRWVAGFTRNLGSCTAFKAEAWGLLDGLRLVKKLNLTNVWVECDSNAVIQLVLSDKVGGEGTYSIMAEIRKLLTEDRFMNLTHTYREGNRCADWLANWSCDHELGYKDWMNMPPGIGNLLLGDALGVSTPRFVFM